jgi:hypothetical protein
MYSAEYQAGESAVKHSIGDGKRDDAEIADRTEPAGKGPIQVKPVVAGHGVLSGDVWIGRWLHPLVDE